MNTRPIICALIYMGLAACGGGASDIREPTGDSPVAQKAMPSDEEIIAIVYNSAYTAPEGFYVDERADTPQSYSVYHVKDPSVSYELCTDDYYEALEWEAADNESRSVRGYYVGSYENGRYFEFIRELSYADDVGNVAGPTSPGFARVFKCSAVNRDGVDRNLRDGYAGTLNNRPLTALAVTEFTEYMWQFAFFATSHRKVLDSYATEWPNSFDHTLRLAFIFPQGADLCDRIEVVDWTFSADKTSGELTKEFRFLRAIESRLVAGAPQLCN